MSTTGGYMARLRKSICSSALLLAVGTLVIALSAGHNELTPGSRAQLGGSIMSIGDLGHDCRAVPVFFGKQYAACITGCEGPIVVTYSVDQDGCSSANARAIYDNTLSFLVSWKTNEGEATTPA